MNSTDVIREEIAHSINGVLGRLSMPHWLQLPWKPGTFANQTWKSEARSVKGYGVPAKLTVNIRFDDNCKNGHNSFAITGDVVATSGRNRDLAGGCVHEEIAKVFPELAPLIKWHLVSTDRPMHYAANVMYHASDREDMRHAPGTPKSWSTHVKFGNSPALLPLGPKFATWCKEQVLVGTHWSVEAVEHVNSPGTNYKFGPKYTFTGYAAKWHECPFDIKEQAEAFAEAMNKFYLAESGDDRIQFVEVPTSWAEGKERNLNAARECAVWSEATDEELCAPDLKEKLEARLPSLMAQFRADMEAAGFMWEAPGAGG